MPLPDRAPRTREEAEQVIRSSPLSGQADLLVRALRPSIRLHLRRAGAAAPVGTTRVGGDPDLPEGLAWPTWPATQPRMFGRRTEPVETALAFVAQLRLSELAPLDPGGPLPRAGMLWFFYDTRTQPWGLGPAETDGACVLFEPDERAPLHRTPRPEAGECDRLAPCDVRLAEELTLPSWIELDLDDDGFDAYDALQERLAGPSATGWAPETRVLGHAQAIQAAPEECGPDVYRGPPERAASATEADWRLLLQIDSDEDAHGACFGDLGRVYFLIHREDLRERRFERTWYTLQCT